MQVVIMGKHSEWRKLAKKTRRKRIRRLQAQARDQTEEEEQRKRESSPTYRKWLEIQRKAEEFQAEEEARIHAEQKANWQRVEEEAQKQWRELQKKLELAREERQKQNAKIKAEWEKELQRLKELKEIKEREAEIKRIEAERLKDEIESFIANGGDTPEQLKKMVESNPGKVVCPFFSKTAACRFRESCSRNHIRPHVSCTLLIPNFYNHYSLEKIENEPGSDSNLEFEIRELYDDFKQFFYDVVPELETFGNVVNVKVCSNREVHLRGNVYVQYSQTREAIKAFRVLNGRYYGGKQLNVEFCGVWNWKSAICGLFFQRKCPKGSSCNFLHVFKNPNNFYPHIFTRTQNIKVDSVEDRRNWRWSESPERNHDTDDWENRVESTPKRHSSPQYVNGSQRKRKRSRSRSRRSDYRRNKSRSRSPETNYRRNRSKSRSPESNYRRNKSRSKSRESSYRRNRLRSGSRESSLRKNRSTRSPGSNYRRNRSKSRSPESDLQTKSKSRESERSIRRSKSSSTESDCTIGKSRSKSKESDRKFRRSRSKSQESKCRVKKYSRFMSRSVQNKNSSSREKHRKRTYERDDRSDESSQSDS